MKIHKEGFVTLIITLVVLVAVNSLIFTLTEWYIASIVVLVFSAAVFLFFLWFFRMPSRKVILDENLIVSPADGVVVAIEETEEPEYFKDKRLQVSVFMSPLNVHSNAYPVTGNVKYYKYHPGKYLVAWHPKSSLDNERNTLVIEKEDGTAVLVRQIAGAVARRIVCYAREGNEVLQGDELGFIKFGSRVDLFLPPEVNVKVAVGQKVTGKTSVIGSFH
ncbi:MAG: phosphatidylserine decarboxylase family protein [Bacteroidales bacterium]